MAPAAGIPGSVTEGKEWSDWLAELPVDLRVKAVAACELAADRAADQSEPVVAAVLRATAAAEGLDEDQPWIAAAAADIVSRPPRQ